MSTTVEQLLAHKSQHIWFVAPDATVQQAVALFGQHEIGAVLVCDDSGLIGILNERCCVQKLLYEGTATLASRVREVMRTDVTAIAPTDRIERCMSLMTELRTRHLPVVDRGRVVGVISMGDVIFEMIGERDSMIESLEGYISGSPSVRPPAH
ncbi:MAG TPA: CBS domain-containing protein [Polyangiales bacterium]|nr:CBS domain-containing protein [Polyangiales bacterium]